MEFPSFISGLRSYTAIEIQTCDPAWAFNGISRRERRKTLQHSVLRELLPPQPSTTTVHLMFAVLETTVFKTFTPISNNYPYPWARKNSRKKNI